ncbi:MAG: c-type cytochrome [Bryobacteraceae bacterium]
MKTKIAVVAVIGLAAAISVSRLGAQNATRSVWDGVYSADQAKTGQADYKAQCAACHGDQLEGGEMAPALAGADFMSNWSGLTLGDLFDRIKTTMPATNPGSLSSKATAEIVAYILQVNNFPAGQTTLPTQTEVLKQIHIDANKPAQK